MSPRPRKVTDEQLFSAALAVMNRVGPNELTLAAIAREAGVTPAVLVQRFGSKRDLLLALSQRFSDGSGGLVAALARRHTSPLAALRAYADCVADMAATPAAFVRNLAYLQTDLTDPEFRRHLAKHAKATRAGLRRLLDRAVRAGELTSDTPTARLARTIEAVLSGSMLTWVIYQQGSASKWIRADLSAVLGPYLARRSLGSASV
jgi:AcrR family transcriptional regulator